MTAHLYDLHVTSIGENFGWKAEFWWMSVIRPLRLAYTKIEKLKNWVIHILSCSDQEIATYMRSAGTAKHFPNWGGWLGTLTGGLKRLFS